MHSEAGVQYPVTRALHLLHHPRSFIWCTFSRRHFRCASVEMLRAITAVLNRITPLGLAESWDNVGLLLEPGKEETPRKSITLFLHVNP
jgi:hypothetical protein